MEGLPFILSRELPEMFTSTLGAESTALACLHSTQL